jgi:hypothetical protein
MSKHSLRLYIFQALVIVLFYWSCQGSHQSGGDEGIGIGGNSDSDKDTTAIAAKPVSSGSAKVTDPTASGLGIPFARTALSRYVFPVMSGTFGSAWCTCRNIGTSPHVGQDIIDNGVGLQRSIAMSNGQIVGMTFDSACGWRVQFKDSMGSIWHYVHLNKPLVAESQIVPRGTLLGLNSDYPKEGCGSGPHLHLERRSSGFYGSAEEFRTCQYGATSCYYNPRPPIERAAVVQSESARISIVAESPLSSPPTSTFALDTLADSKSFEALPLLADSSKCKMKLVDRESDDAIQERYSMTSGDLEVTGFAAQPADSGWLSLKFAVGLRSNENNLCVATQPPEKPAKKLARKDCIVSWSAYRMEGARKVAILGGVGTAGQKIAVTQEQGMCMKQKSSGGKGQIVFEVETRSGKRLSKMVRL